MKISVPNLGNTSIAAKALFEGLQTDYVLPQVSSKSTLELGSKYSPEEICLPFKIMVGNYIEAMEKGADTFIITGSCGPCRYGEYCELQINILKKLNPKAELIVIDAPGDIGKDELLKRIGKISEKSPLCRPEKIKAVYNALRVINAVDDIEKALRLKAGYEINRGQCKRILYEFKRRMLEAKGVNEMLSLIKEYKKIVGSVPIDKNRRVIKVAIIGEIYTIIEPFSNLYIEDKLMDYGVSTMRTLYPSWWVKNLVMSPLKLHSIDIRMASRKYLPYYIGGHGRECIGEAVLAHKHGCDGAIQIFPFGCMPEIVSKSILPTISKDKDFPIMTLVVDELTGEAGYVTRIEAFIDLLERRIKKCII
ncbi:2-hydroxyglutaryl-CoA dehydratase [Clostridium thermarum]|uniref:2-hydroxyglutaryl-CoA dehydratase n=1 Tax=Clostridium thermarum TaxID=1716543 RepID=UPI00112475C5|nr:2-hydroxyglutaryl-CoA dehydratase [Clostridium thermarum]